MNILSEGMNKIGVRSTEYTLVENPTVDDRLATDLKSGGSLKQEGKTNFYQIFLYGQEKITGRWYGCSSIDGNPLLIIEPAKK